MVPELGNSIKKHIHMKLFKTIFIFLLPISILAQKDLKITSEKNFSIGKSIELSSVILDEKRTLNIYLPASYYSSSKKYPVIYLLDGSKDEDFIHIAGLVQFGSFSWINMIEESIVIGISNIDRKRDFTFPTSVKKDKEEFPSTGGSEKFIEFIEKELQPLINQKYKTTSTKTIIGQSLGGLLATEILFKKPHLFDNYIIVSPSLWWDNESLLNMDYKHYTSKKSIYIAVGTEGEVMERTTKELHTKLGTNKLKNTTLYFNFLEKQNHGNVLHLAVYDAFEKVFNVKKE